MSYPAGAGPYAGRFTAGAWSPIAEQGSGGPAPSPFPRILTERGVKDATSPKMTATFDAPTTGQGWLLTRITVSCSAPSVATIYIGGLTPENIVSGTPAGALDEHDPSSPIPVPYGQRMYVVWTGSAIVAGCIAVARIEYFEVL